MNVTPHPEQTGRIQQMADSYKKAKDWQKQQKQQRHVVDIYGVAPNPSGIAGAGIVEAGTADEVVQKTHSFPMASFCQFEVLPLTDFDQQMDSIADEIPKHFRKP
jgi:hypothetical protein